MSRREQEIKRIERKVTAKLPPRAFREVTFDRVKIRSEIPALSFDEARRRKGPIYKALQEELYRDGCYMVPELLECLAEKEDALFKSVSIRARIKDDRKLLYDMVDKLKQAELATVKHKQKGRKQSFTSFFEVLQLLEPHHNKYEYAITMVMEKIVSLCHKVDGQEADAVEMITRIYFHYAQYLIKAEQTVLAIDYLKKSLSLVRGHVWSADLLNPFDRLTLHECISQKLAKQLLLRARSIVRHEPEEAEEMTRLATLLLAEIGKEANSKLYCDTYLERAYMLMEVGKFRQALHCIEQIRTTVTARTEYKFVKLNIKYYLLGGQCADNTKETELAISKYKKALRLAQIYDFKTEEAEILVSMGKILAKNARTTSIAKRCYEQAIKIYVDFNDMPNKKKATYLMAKLKADEITPLFMTMLKESTTNYCAFYKLRQWKNRCRPFWNVQGEEMLKQETDNIYCLINEEQPDASEESKYYVIDDPKAFMAD